MSANGSYGSDSRSRNMLENENEKILVALNSLRNKLWQIAGNHDCSSDDRKPKRIMSFAEALGYLKNTLPFEDDVEFSDVMLKCAELFLENPDFGIRVYNKNKEIVTVPDSSTNSSYAFLESIYGEKSFLCRLRQSFGIVMYKLMLAFFGLLGVIFIGVLIYWYWLQKKEFHKEVLALTESITNLLQKTYEESLTNPDIKPYMSILYIRDNLIPLSERKYKMALWEAAVNLLQEHDSRIRVEVQIVDGEDHQVWRWIQPPSPTRLAQPKKVWQGQAFENLDGGANAPPYNLTPCLKVRNMFDPDVEYGEDWHVHIQDAILEKCEGVNGIVHIKVDTSSHEGCVYVKCSSSDAAGKVFRAFHGWWFDGNLVTVRYLRLERYHERFPEAIHENSPLQPSSKRPSFGFKNLLY